MQHTTIYNTDDLVKQMETFLPKSPFAKKTSVTYRQIATCWLEEVPLIMLDAMKQSQNIFGHFQLSMLTIRKKFPYQYTKDKKRFHWFDWMVENAPLWKEISKGFKVNTQNTQLTTVSALIDLSEQLRYTDSQAVLDKYIADLEDQGALLNGEAANGHELSTVKIDFDSLCNYIQSTEHSLQSSISNAQRQTLTGNLNTAMQIYHLAVASEMKETCPVTDKVWYYIPAVTKKSEFGRVYHKGINLQNCHKQVREAALGKCLQIDLKTSVFAFYKNLANKLDVTVPIAIDRMLNNKDMFRANLAKTLSGMKGSKEFHLSLVKSAITALGFGAKTQDNPYSVSINKIIFDADAREQFVTHPDVIEIAQFVDDLVAALKAMYKESAEAEEQFRSALPKACFDTRGVLKWKTVLAWLYQQEETHVMEKVMEAAKENDVTVRLWVHDAVYIDSRNVQSTGFIAYANSIAYKINPQFGFDKSENTVWKGAIAEKTEHLEDIAAHEALMRREEQRAQQWAAQPL